MPGQSQQWEDVDGLLMLPPHEQEGISMFLSSMFKLNGIDTDQQGINIFERAVETASKEAAIGISMLSHQTHDEARNDASVGVHPENGQVLYFYSRQLGGRELALASLQLIYRMDMMLKLVQSPLRLLKASEDIQ